MHMAVSSTTSQSLLRYREHTIAPSVKSGPSIRRVIDLDAKVIDLTILDD